MLLEGNVKCELVWVFTWALMRSLSSCKRWISFFMDKGGLISFVLSSDWVFGYFNINTSLKIKNSPQIQSPVENYGPCRTFLRLYPELRLLGKKPPPAQLQLLCWSWCAADAAGAHRSLAPGASGIFQKRLVLGASSIPPIPRVKPLIQQGNAQSELTSISGKKLNRVL